MVATNPSGRNSHSQRREVIRHLLLITHRAEHFEVAPCQEPARQSRRRGGGPVVQRQSGTKLLCCSRWITLFQFKHARQRVKVSSFDQQELALNQKGSQPVSFNSIVLPEKRHFGDGRQTKVRGQVQGKWWRETCAKAVPVALHAFVQTRQSCRSLGIIHTACRP